MKIATTTFNLLRQMYGEKGIYLKYSHRMTSAIFGSLEGLNGGVCSIRWDYFARANM
jgi:hypothetical protein